MTSDPDAAELLRAIAESSDKNAFAMLFRSQAPRVRGWFVRWGHADVADELTQEVLLRVWRRAGTYDARKGSAVTWMYAIARNARIDHLRKPRMDADPQDPAFRAATLESPDDAVVRRAEASALRDALTTLPDDQARTLQDAYFEHKSLATIAQEHQVPLGTVKSRVRLALERLRAHLGSTA